MTAIPIRITTKFILGHPAHFVALGFGTGLSPVAPGTVGTLLAFPFFLALKALLGPFDSALSAADCLAALGIFFVLGIWACEKTGRDLGVADHGGMNWDEVVAFMLVLLFTPETWGWQLFAFFAFRFFDVLKPPPIGHFDRTLKGGLGVMFDDILAAFYTLLLMAAVKQVLG